MTGSLKNTCNAKHALEQLDAFENGIIAAIFREEIDFANRKQIHDIGSNPNMKNRELHFRRGTIFANESFFSMFASIRGELEGRFALETAEKQTNPKKGK